MKVQSANIMNAVAVLALLTTTLVTACEGTEVDTDEEHETDQLLLEQASDQIPFNHPMQSAVLANGEVALWDSKNDPDGRRYVIGDGEYTLSEGGVPRSMPSLFSVTRSRITAGERQTLASLNGAPPP